MNALEKKLRKIGRTGWITICVVAVVLISARVALPYVVKHYVNKSLSDMDGYRGEVQDIDMNLYRGAYVIDGLKIVTVDNDDVELPFVDIDNIDISIEWKALLHGSIVGEVVFERPRVNFVAGDKVDEAQTGSGVDWREQVKDLVPLQINRLEIVNGDVHYLEPNAKPTIDIAMDSLYVVVANLTNSSDASGSLVANAEMSARMMGKAPIYASAHIDPYDPEGTFDVNAELEGFEVAELNDLLKEYLKIDVVAGTFSLYAEAKAESGDLEGYVKPLLNDLDIVNKPEDGSVFRKAWEGFIAGTAKLFQNRKTDNVGTKIPISGDLKSPDFKVLPTLLALGRNAFIKALRPHIDHEISFVSTDEPPKKERKRLLDRNK